MSEICLKEFSKGEKKNNKAQCIGEENMTKS